MKGGREEGRERRGGEGREGGREKERKREREKEREERWIGTDKSIIMSKRRHFCLRHHILGTDG